MVCQLAYLMVVWSAALMDLKMVYLMADCLAAWTVAMSELSLAVKLEILMVV